MKEGELFMPYESNIWFTIFGITYKSASENIAKGQTSVKQVVAAWINSRSP